MYLIFLIRIRLLNIKMKQYLALLEYHLNEDNIDIHYLLLKLNQHCTNHNNNKSIIN